MATDSVTIRSVKQYFNEFIAEPANHNGGHIWLAKNRTRIRAQLLDAFRKEIFGQLIFKLGPEVAEMKPDDLTDLDGVQNILTQSFRKWRRLCILCSEYGVPFITLEDLKSVLEDPTSPISSEEATDDADNIPEAQTAEPAAEAL